MRYVDVYRGDRSSRRRLIIPLGARCAACMRISERARSVSAAPNAASFEGWIPPNGLSSEPPKSKSGRSRSIAAGGYQLVHKELAEHGSNQTVGSAVRRFYSKKRVPGRARKTRAVRTKAMRNQVP